MARGSPLVVRMFVPLWLVNATNLPIAAVVVATQPPPPTRGPTAKEGRSQGDMRSAASSSTPRVMQTRARPT